MHLQTTGRVGIARRAVWGLAFHISVTAQAALFTYQGQLKRVGAPVQENCDLTFRLFDAAADGAQIGDDVILLDQAVTSGLLQAELDFGAAAFNGSPRWLEVSLLCGADVIPVTLSPRQAMTAAPHAINADALDGLDSSAFLQTVPNPLSLTSGPSSAVIRGTNTSGASGASGVIGEASATAGSTFGVWGLSGGLSGIGVLGQHTSNAGTAAGVAGESLSGATAAVGVYGRVAGLVAVNYGVFGESPSGAGRGVYGKATATSGSNYGVYGEGISPSGAGMFAFSTLGDGVFARSDGASKAAMSAQTTNADGWAVLARHTSPAGTQAAVQGETASGINGAKGVYGLATNSAGATHGVFGESAGTTAHGVTGLVSAATGVNFGVYGETNSTTSGAAGVFGLADASSGLTYGVFGQSDSNSGYSVFGLHMGSGRAVYGSSSSGSGVYATTATGSMALYGERTSNGNRGWIGGTSEAIWGESSSGTGIVGKTTNGVSAVFGDRIANGNRGFLGTATEGVSGQAASGNGVSGVTADLNGYGGYFRNDGGGAALFADGVARVRTLEIIDGGDLAEPFVVKSHQPIRAGSGSDPTTSGAEARRHEGTKVEPGMVVVIDPREPGALTLSEEPYDRKVAGVISGANGLSPGMVMKATPRTTAPGDQLVALSGRVWCWCDATTEGGSGPIEPGDMLTSSRTVGHAMKVTADIDAHGAVIGKAMTALPEGRGLVLVLVNLQ